MTRKPGKKVIAKQQVRSTPKRAQRPSGKRTAQTRPRKPKMVAQVKGRKLKAQPRKRTSPKPLTKSQLLRQPQHRYMSPEQLEFFKQLLSRQHRDVNRELADLQRRLLEEQNDHHETDTAEQAAHSEESAVIAKMVNREQRLLHKIELALLRIERGEYGYCEVSAKPIGLRRLLLNPTTPYCVEVKEQLEKTERKKFR